MDIPRGSTSRTRNGHKKGSNSLILSEVAEQIPEEQTYVATLRRAIYGGVKESDVEEIVKGISERAKAGDAKAIKHFFDYVMGGKQSVRLIQNNYYGRE